MRRYGESPQHEKQKERIGSILKAKGWQVEIEKPFKVLQHTYPYYADVYAQNFSLYNSRRACPVLQGSGRRIIVEIQGFKGHKSKAAFQADGLRIADIRNSHGQDIEYYTVYLNKRIGPLDIRRWTMDDIIEHLGL